MTPDDRASGDGPQDCGASEPATREGETRARDDWRGSVDEGLARQVDEARAGGSEATGGSVLASLEGSLDAAAESLDPDRLVSSLASDDPPGVRALRLTISTLALLGFVLSFGAAAGSVVALGRWVIDAGLVGSPPVAAQQRLVAGVALLLPPASFLFVALYDDADLEWPSWPDGHPPLGDVWLLVVLAYGLVTLALATPKWPWLLRSGGWAAAIVAAYGVLPVWLGHRCLSTPGWVLGTLAGLTALVLPLAATVVAVALVGGGPDAGTVGTALVLAVAGVGLPYGLAARSPGPVSLSHHAAGGLGRAGRGLRDALRRVRSSVERLAS